MKHKGILLALVATTFTLTTLAKTDNYDFSAVSPSGHTLYYKYIKGTWEEGYPIIGLSVTYPKYSEVTGYYGGYSKPIGDVVIPDSVNGYAVKAIDFYCFYQCKQITSVTIPNGVERIWSCAFEQCDGMKSVNIPDSTKMIGYYAFRHCINLTEVSIPDAVTELGMGAFSDCSKLTTVSLPKGLKQLGTHMFYNCGDLTTVNIPDSLERIESYAFCNCSTLTSIILPESLTHIDDFAFNFCTTLTNISLPKQLTSIGYSAFGSCFNIDSISLPDGLTYISDYAFTNCFRLTSVIIPDGVDFIGKLAFNACNQLVSVTLPDGLKEIGEGAFQFCYKLQNINLPDGIEEIGSGAFQFCALTSISIPDKITEILPYTFYCCDSLKSVHLPDSLTGIGEKAFSNCKSLREITIPANVTVIGDEAFYKCASLANVYLLPTFPPIKYNNTWSYSTHYHIPCGTTEIYTTSWPYTYSWLEPEADVLLSLTANDSAMGDAFFIQQNGNKVLCTDSSAIIAATPNYGYHFSHWSNGAVNNPDTLHLSCDSVVEAVFEKNYYLVATLPSDTVRGTVTGSDSMAYLDSVTLMATPNYGYHFAQWGDGDTNNPRTMQVTRDSLFTALFDKNLYTIALAVDTSIHGTVSGAGTFEYLDEKTITATPNYGYHFTQWSDGNTNNPRTLTLTQDTAFTALFANNVYAVITQSADTVHVTVTGSDSIAYLDSVTLTAMPNYGYHFAQWGDGDTNNPRTLQVTRDSIFTALFAKNSYSVTLSVDTSIHGTVMSDTGSCEYLSMKTITATPNYGYHFTQWSDGNTDNPRTLTLTQDTAFTAFFANNIYAVSTQSADTVRGTVTGSDSVAYLDSVTLTATPNYGYHFAQWGDGDTSNPRTLQVTRDSLFTALFDKNLYTIALAVDTAIHGHVSGAGPYEYLDTSIHGTVRSTGSYEYLDKMRIKAIPNYGYHFTQWSDGNTDNPRTLTLTQDTAFTALFDKNIYCVEIHHWHLYKKVVVEIDSVAYLDSVAITATPNYGYHFAYWHDHEGQLYVDWNWSSEPINTSTDNPRTVQVTKTMSYVAIYELNQYSIMLSVDTSIHGTVSGAGAFDYYSNDTITATPNYGYHFTYWSDGDTSNPRILRLTQDTAFTAIFAKNLYTITTASNDAALGTVSAGGVYEYLDSVTLTATCTAAHHHFVQWSDGVKAAVRTLTVERDSLLTAFFAIDTHLVSVTANDSTFGTVSGGGEYPYGTTVTFTAYANEGYHLGQWMVGDIPLACPYNGYGSAVADSLVLTGDTSIVALFTPDVTPALCMVGVENWKNRLLWEPLEVPCSAYRLYREGDVSGQYDLIAEVPAGSATAYTDSSSKPMTRSYRYRISGVDPYGYEGPKSDEHKTMHLTISQGIGNRWNLVWTEYEGAEYTTYVIYRGSTQNDLVQIDVMPSGGNTTYTDEEAPDGEVYYQVGVMMTGSCGEPATTPMGTKGSTISRSNIATNGEVGVGTVTDDGVRVYATGGRIVVEGAGNIEVAIYDMTGRRIDNLDATLPAGVYMVRIGHGAARRVVVM